MAEPEREETLSNKVLAFILATVVRWLLKFRYRLEVTGLEAVTSKGQRGILFLPNHSALVDPVLMVSLLHRQFAPRPLADEHQVTRTAFGKVVALFGARTLPNLEREGAHVRDRMRAAVMGLVGDLRHGDNVLFYPAGHLKRGYLEDIGSMSGTETIVKNLPDVRVVLVRQTGLWGSGFSLAFTGHMPDFGGALMRGVKGWLASFLFFMPRRHVTFEFVEPEDFPRTGTRTEINRYLEEFFNANATKNTYVPYSIWEKGGPQERPEPEYWKPAVDVTSVPAATRNLVLAHLEDETGRSDLTLDMQLSRDLGMDSLTQAELVAWIEQDFGFSVGTPESLRTVSDVVLAAAGKGTSAVLADIRKPGPSWFTDRANMTPIVVPPHRTITEVFLAQAARKPDQPAVADQTSGQRSYRDLVTAILALKPHLEKIPGEHIGLMLPASVGATVCWLATIFAGKTTVMVNWTTGVRTITAGLDSLGVTRIITAKALVTKLGSLGIDLSEISNRFLFVEDLMAGITLPQKLAAAIKSRFSWAELRKVTPREHAVVLFTSGSESTPKAVPLTHDNMLTDVRIILKWDTIRERDITIGLLPPFHSFGLTCSVLLPLAAGLRTVFHSNPNESAVLARITQAYGVTFAFATPTFFAGLVRVAEDRQLATMRLAVLGGEKVPDALHQAVAKRWPNLIIVEGYGITECSPTVSCSKVSNPVAGSIGEMLETIERAIVDVAMTHRVPQGETGLLLLRGPTIFPGYLHHTGESPFVTFEGKEWYRTGDLIHERADGILFFDGRLKRFVKLGGEMISLPAIESVLQQKFGNPEGEPVLAVEALGHIDAPDIVLFTTLSIDRADANAAIREAGFSALHHIRQVIPVESIPVMGTGKTNYRALKAAHTDAPGDGTSA
jgi:acyl-CoA synthetase (AMP-forming)/AMP-acid ligase II/1-acyl-sn-glycerol-3-phosphate acyltransferase/acyl carrier protein